MPTDAQYAANSGESVNLLQCYIKLTESNKCHMTFLYQISFQKIFTVESRTDYQQKPNIEKIQQKIKIFGPKSQSCGRVINTLIGTRSVEGNSYLQIILTVKSNFRNSSHTYM